jgi:hypothetical protein
MLLSCTKRAEANRGVQQKRRRENGYAEQGQTPAGYVLEVRDFESLAAYRVEEGVKSGSAPVIRISCCDGARPGRRDSSQRTCSL